MKNNNSKIRKDSFYLKHRLLLFLIFFVVLFMGVGYASINNVILNTNGLVSFKTQKGVFITSIDYDSDNNADDVNSKINDFTSTFVDSSIILGTTSNSYITYKVTITNNSSDSYIFNDILYDSSEALFYDNDKITIDYDNQYKILESKKNMVVTITFKYVNDYTPSSAEELNSYINFDFRRVYNVKYNDSVISDELISGYDLKINFLSASESNVSGTANKTIDKINNTIVIEYYVDTIPNSVNVTGNNNYSYIKPNLTISNINANVSIEELTLNTGLFAKYLTDLIEGKSVDDNGIYNLGTDNTTNCTYTLAYDETDDNNLRYVGSNPCNYVSYAGDTWRIIGVMNNVGENSLVKLIDPIYYSNSSKWNTQNNSNWEETSLFNELNNDYLSDFDDEYINYMADVYWNIGGPSATMNDVYTFYEEEVSKKTSITAKVGMFSVADYAFATSNRTSTCLESVLSSWNQNSCVNNDWLFDSSIKPNIYTINYSKNSLYAYRISNVGRAYRSTVGTNSYIKGAIYLKSEVKYEKGDGTSNSPYEISID